MASDGPGSVRHLVISWADRVLALQNEDGSCASAIAWRKGLVVSADEAAGDQIRLHSRDGRQIDAELVGRDPSTDLALYKADIDPPPLAPAAEVLPGDFALAIGRSATSECVAAGIVAETGGAWRSTLGGTIDRRIRLDLRLPQRAHGGAIVDAAGHLIGLAAFGPRRTAIVIPAETISRIVDRLASAGSIARGYIGVQLHPLSDGHRGVGAIVVRLDDGGPAAAAGLLVGDSIVSWNGEAISGVRDIFQRLGPDSVGATVKLGLLRAQQSATVDIVIAERPLK